ncbi:UNVERIFIED_CONTAM: hypothetical protein Sradi_7284700 [Sesamum radiatum]|uniref:Uncharacterized protein n=1 Tax=Sesamum radiatum TaxID=300843 RepID=A0AAW2IJN9_SESRA
MADGRRWRRKQEKKWVQGVSSIFGHGSWATGLERSGAPAAAWRSPALLAGDGGGGRRSTGVGEETTNGKKT